MLEHPALLLRPWQPSADAPFRLILDPATGEVLGRARWRPPAPSTWLRWLRRATLEVVETEDESLVFTVCRCWGWPARWQAADALGRPVGQFRQGVRGAFILSGLSPGAAVMVGRDRLGRWLVMARPAGPVYLSEEAGWKRMGALACSEAGLRVEFDDEGTDNPYTRMVVLAAALVEPD